MITFLDFLAQYILAVLYTSDHIDVSFSIPMLAQVKSQNKENKRRVGVLTKQVSTAVKGYRTGVPNYTQSILYRVNTGQASEVDYDCIAVALAGNNLLVSRNYKKRKMPGDPKKVNEEMIYQFGGWSPTQIRAIVRGLQTEFSWNAADIVDTVIKRVVFLEVKKDPTTESESAAPHAEMQLVSYCLETDQLDKLSRSGVGVSKGCCIRCAEMLNVFGVPFNYERFGNDAPKNWATPDQIEVCRAARISVNLRFNYTGQTWR
ncbi:hypothetical protein [Corallococcus sp. AB018]|uniref:hypothetical protein n=1 Tax=Corallococcus sp. AB018 TaxID=2316715 RepID=UPI00131551D0|nr:hypothetical protein [Corallococcus sp. AB018]